MKSNWFALGARVQQIVLLLTQISNRKGVIGVVIDLNDGTDEINTCTIIGCLLPNMERKDK